MTCGRGALRGAVLAAAVMWVPALSGAAPAADHCRQGMDLYRRGRLAEALREFEAAVKLHPRSDQAQTGMGVVLNAQGRLEEAIACWRRAVALNPRNVRAHVNLGSALNDRGKPAEAVAACQAALRIDPSSVGAHYNLGRARYRQKKVAAAIREYEAALKLRPDFAPAWLALGTAHANATRNAPEAVRCFRRYLELTPNPPQCTCWIKQYLRKFASWQVGKFAS